MDFWYLYIFSHFRKKKDKLSYNLKFIDNVPMVISSSSFSIHQLYFFNSLRCQIWAPRTQVYLYPNITWAVDPVSFCPCFMIIFMYSARNPNGNKSVAVESHVNDNWVLKINHFYTVYFWNFELKDSFSTLAISWLFRPAAIFTC